MMVAGVEQSETFIMTLITRSIFVGLLVAVLGTGAYAQDADPPSRAARLSEFSGQVWLYNTDSGEWVSAVRNRPITAGDRLATDPGAHAEFELGSTSVRLDGGTELEVVALDDDRLSMDLHSGSAITRVRDMANAGAVDLSTDDGRFIVQRAGTYRFDRDGSASRVSVYSGQAKYEGPNSGLGVNAGQRAEFWIDSGGVAQYNLSAPVNDAFLAWNNDRDRRIVESVSARYVSPEMTGVEDLDRYGRWEQSADYGPLWVPAAVAVDWAPYRNGHWAWVQPWGWTWVDDAPWGFAPFHYGRWVYVRNNWCWTPGARVVRPVYAPALVAWMGGSRGGVSITVGGGPAVGWVPLAPREVFVPSYRVSPRYAQNINITHVTNVTVINNVFANPQGPRDFSNRHNPNAVTVIPAAVMSSRQPVAPAAAQWRGRPEVREIANNPQPGRTVAVLAPPVAAPQAPARPADPRNVRPPPGVTERPVVTRPGLPPRERDRERDRDRDNGRPESPRAQPGAPQQPQPQPQTPPTATPAPAVNPGNPNAPRGPGRTPPPAPSAQPAQPAQPAPAAEIAPPTRVQPSPAGRPAPAAPAAAQEGPMMRPLPVRRGEDRREPGRPNAESPSAPEARPPRNEPDARPPRGEPEGRQPRVEQPRVEPPQRPAPAQAPAVAPAPRPAEPARPVAVPQPVRPAPSVTPTPPAQQRPEPQVQQRQESPQIRRPEPPQQRGDEQRRDQQR